MININQFVGQVSAAATLKSTTVGEILGQAIKAGKKFTGFKFTHSAKTGADRLVFGSWDADNNMIKGSDMISLRVSDKLVLTSTDPKAKLAEVSQYPVYYGQGTSKNELGEPRFFKTIAPVGTYEATPATALDLAKDLSALGIV